MIKATTFRIPFRKYLIIVIYIFVGVSCTIPPTRSELPENEPETAIEMEPTQQPPVPTIIVSPPSEPAIMEPIPSEPSQQMPEEPPVVVVPPPSEPEPPITPEPPVEVPTLPPSAPLPQSLVSLRDKTAVPGGVAWISLRSESDTPPNIVYQKRRVVVLRDDNNWVALVGVPLSTKPGKHTVIDQQTEEQYTFQVNSKKYKTQRINIKNKRKVNPNREDLQRIQRERPLIRAALASPWQPTATSPLPLMQPVQGRYSSPFGLRRFFNGQRRNPHTGLDIAAPQGTSIAAAADGKVVNAGDYFYTGNTIIIDHGLGIVTLYGHLNTIAIEEGQMVERGETIGTVGKTGRATGPHLHWSVVFNNTMIDPTLVIE